jgi:capsular polysaccharide biosynthesis protein
VLVITVVIAAYAVTSASLQQAPTYEASARVLVGWQQEGQWQTLEYREPPLTLEMMHAIDSRPVAEETILRLGLQMDPDELLDNLTVEQFEGTQFIVLTYEDTDPERAQHIVNTVGKVSSEFSSESSSKFTATVWEKAELPTTPVSPHPLRNGLLALVIGLGLCAGTVIALPGVGARRAAGTLGPTVPRTDLREAERSKEQELLRALGRCGKLTVVGAALETSLSVEESRRILEALAVAGHLQVTVEHGRLYYAFWERD